MRFSFLFELHLAKNFCLWKFVEHLLWTRFHIRHLIPWPQECEHSLHSPQMHHALYWMLTSKKRLKKSTIILSTYLSTSSSVTSLGSPLMLRAHLHVVHLWVLGCQKVLGSPLFYMFPSQKVPWIVSISNSFKHFSCLIFLLAPISPHCSLTVILFKNLGTKFVSTRRFDNPVR